MERSETCSVREALSRRVSDLTVNDDDTLEFGPTLRDHDQYFANVELQKFEDLQLLGFVPRGLKEDDVRGALSRDDETAYQLASGALGRSFDYCHCNERAGRGAGPVSASDRLIASYKEVRNDNNPALASLLSQHYKVDLPFYDPLPRLVRSWVGYFDKNRRINPYVPIAVLQDVTIHRDAVLVVDKKAKSFLCRNLLIHRTGAFSQRSSYMKLWAANISHFVDILDLTIPPGVAPWALGN